MAKKKQKVNFKKLFLSIIFVEFVGIIGTLPTTPNIPTWYADLYKPSFNPPNWVFGPVWTLLYLLMGISWYLVATKKGNLGWFWLQLVLNCLWSFLFFGLKNPALALLEIGFLWFSIYMTIKSFWKVSPLAGKLLVPYLLWVSFALVLNYAIYLLN